MTEYEDYIDQTTGVTFLVNRTTGEVLESRTVTVPVGSRIYTPAQQEAHKKWRELQEEQKWRRRFGEKFSFVSSESTYDDINPATAARLIYLATFLWYDGKLMKTQRTAMKRNDLGSVLKISKAQSYRFWDEVKDKYICEAENGELFMRKDFFIRGKLPHGGRFQKFFIEAVRKLYLTTETARHKYLGYVFQLLPFVNVEYNLLCHNPEEKNLDDVRAMTVDEICSAIDYCAANKARLMDIYSKITFPVGNRQENFCAFVSTGGKYGKTRMFINPRILYYGNDANQVRVLAKFCEG